jgi:hypothetical protein
MVGSLRSWIEVKWVVDYPLGILLSLLSSCKKILRNFVFALAFKGQ